MWASFGVWALILNEHYKSDFSVGFGVGFSHSFSMFFSLCRIKSYMLSKGRVEKRHAEILLDVMNACLHSTYLLLRTCIPFASIVSRCRVVFDPKRNRT